MEFKNINIRNLYIDLLNKIKNVEGVDKDYVDGLIEVIDYHLTALDTDLSAIESVIPESASVSNPLATEDDIPAAQVNSDWNATSGVAEILNKPTIPVVPTVINPVYVEWIVRQAAWVSVSGVYHWGVDIDDILLVNIPFINFIRPYTEDVETADEKSAYNEITQITATLDMSHNRTHIEVIAGATLPQYNFKLGMIGWKQA